MIAGREEEGYPRCKMKRTCDYRGGRNAASSTSSLWSLYPTQNIRPPFHKASRKEGNGGNGGYVQRIEENHSVRGIVFTPYTYFRGEGYHDEQGRKRGECGCQLKRSAAALVTERFSQELTIKMSQTEDNTQLTYMSPFLKNTLRPSF